MGDGGDDERVAVGVVEDRCVDGRDEVDGGFTDELDGGGADETCKGCLLDHLLNA